MRHSRLTVSCQCTQNVNPRAISRQSFLLFLSSDKEKRTNIRRHSGTRVSPTKDNKQSKRAHARLSFQGKMLAVLYHAQWCFIVVYRVVDFVSTLMTTTTSCTSADHPSKTEERHWFLEFLPLVSMASVTWLLRVLQRHDYASFQRQTSLYVRRPERNDLKELFIAVPSDQACPICLEQFADEIHQEQRQIMASISSGSTENAQMNLWQAKECRHVFHAECIIQWCQHQASLLGAYQANDDERRIRTTCLTCPCCRCPLLNKANRTKTPTASSMDPGHALLPEMLQSSWLDTLRWVRRRAVVRSANGRLRPNRSLSALFRYELAGVALWMGMLSEIIRLASRLHQE